MSVTPSDEIEDFLEDDPYRIPALASAPFCKKLSLPAPPVMNIGALTLRLGRELSFPEASAFHEKLGSWNADLFSCMPANERIYEDVKLLSQNPEDVLDAVEEHMRDAPRYHTTSVDLNQHGTVELPEVPDRVEDMPTYVEQVQRYFLSELEAREEAYAKLFFGYLIALVRHIARQAARDSRGIRVVDREAEIRRRTLKAIVGRYYHDAARLAKTIYLHMFLSVTREAARRLSATQSKKKDLFVHCIYEWKGERQLFCLFQPVMQNHGVSTVDGAPLTAEMLRNVNYIRVSLGLLPVRCRMLETQGEKLTEAPPFSNAEPRSSWYLSQKILQKLGSYHRKRNQSKPADIDHPYSRRLDSRNYGSTLECMLEPPDPEREFPCDPYEPPKLTVPGLTEN
nr:transactivating tegument protein VP16 UL48 [Psittacid alphaherpesvirus 6]